MRGYPETGILVFLAAFVGADGRVICFCLTAFLVHLLASAAQP
jgi:hypothetical protein